MNIIKKKMKNKYKKICKTMLEEAKDTKKDIRDIMRDWIMIFEEEEVLGWNRDEFLDCMILCKKEDNKK